MFFVIDLHATDPNKCYYDFFILLNNPEGKELNPRPEHKIYRGNGPNIYEEIKKPSLQSFAMF